MLGASSASNTVTSCPSRPNASAAISPTGPPPAIAMESSPIRNPSLLGCRVLLAVGARPDAVPPRRQDAVRVDRVLDPLGEPPVSVIVEGVLVRGEVHEVQVGAVLAVALLAEVLDQAFGERVGVRDAGLVGPVELHGADHDPGSLTGDHEPAGEVQARAEDAGAQLVDEVGDVGAR